MVVPQGTNISTQGGGGQTFYVGEEGGFVVDVDEGMDVMEASFLISKANILVSDVSKISA